MSEARVLQEYAGFLYEIIDRNGVVLAAPADGQHKAAGKEKHCRAALEEWRRMKRRG